MVDVSIIVPTFDAGNGLVHAIRSVKMQEGLRTQVVVIEDGSTSPSLTLLKENFIDCLHGEVGPISQSRSNIEQAKFQIKYAQQKNSGAYLARLNALSLCDGKFIKFLDQDDELLAGTLQRELEAFEKDVDVVLSNWLIGTASYSQKSHCTDTLLTAPILDNPIDDFLKHGGVYTSAAMYRTSFATAVLKPVGSFVPIKADDWLIFAQICLGGARYKTINNIAYRWNQSDQQLSKKARSNLVAEHYSILSWIESELRENQHLAPQRKKLLANYYSKQLLEANELDDGSLRKFVDKIRDLQPEYRQKHGNKVYQLFCAIFGLEFGVKFYALMKKPYTILFAK